MTCVQGAWELLCMPMTMGPTRSSSPTRRENGGALLTRGGAVHRRLAGQDLMLAADRRARCGLGLPPARGGGAGGIRLCTVPQRAQTAAELCLRCAPGNHEPGDFHVAGFSSSVAKSWHQQCRPIPHLSMARRNSATRSRARSRPPEPGRCPRGRYAALRFRGARFDPGHVLWPWDTG
jgi:hypothetical protein